MAEVERFDCDLMRVGEWSDGAVMQPCADGEWVRYSDYEQERQRVRGAVEAALSNYLSQSALRKVQSALDTLEDDDD